MANIAFIASPYNEVDEIKKQLKEKNLTNKINVYPYGTNQFDLEHEVIITNMRPDKKFGEVLDLGQCINNHGFPEEAYYPPEYTGLTIVDKKNMQNATKHLKLEHLEATIENDVPELITRNNYEQKIEEIKKSAQKLTNLTTRELSNKLEVSLDPIEIISIVAVLFDKIHSKNDLYDKMGRPARGYTSNKNKPVINFLNPESIGWVAETWVELLKEEDEYYTRKYIKSLRTRSKNLLLQKGSFWSLRFFIEWLINEDKIEKEIEKQGSSNGEIEESGYTIEYEGIDIQDEDIPF